jgi:hypothetical protein
VVTTTAPAYTYAWSDSITGLSTRSNLPAGIYAVTVTDSHGCSGSGSDTVIVTAGGLSGAIAASRDAVCAGDSVSLTATGGTAYQWSNGLGATATVQTVVTATTPYTVIVSSDTTACLDTVSKTIYILNPVAGTLDIDYVIDTPNCHLAAFITTYTAVVSGVSDSISYEWRFNGAVVGTDSPQYTPSAVPGIGDTVSCTATYTNACLGEITLTDAVVLGYSSTGFIHNGACDNVKNDTLIILPFLAGVSPFTYQINSLPPVTAQDTFYFTDYPYGSFIVTSTDAKGCTGTALYVIDSTTHMSLSIDTIIKPDCGQNNGSIIVHATGGAFSSPNTLYPYDYYILGNGTPNHDGIFTGLGPGVYNISVSQPTSHYSICDTFIIGINLAMDTAPFTASISNPTQLATCSGDSVLSTGLSVTTSATSPSYLWSTGDTTAAITAYAVGSYTVVVTDTGGCTALDTVIVRGDTLCCQGSIISGTNTTYSYNSATTPFLSQLPALPPGSIVALNGNFQVDTSDNLTTALTFTNITFRMGSDASITLNQGQKLTLDSCTIMSCSEMWSHILLLPPAELIITNSRVMDAMNGIQVPYIGSKVTLNNNQFFNNYRGVYFFVYTYVDSTDYAINNNTFGMSGPMKPAPFGFINYNKPLHGVYFKDCSYTMQIPNPATPLPAGTNSNTFSDMNNGIVVENSTAIINSNFFSNIRLYDADGPGDSHGSAIYGFTASYLPTDPDKLTVQTSPGTGAHTVDSLVHFRACDMGVDVNKMHFYARRNNMDSVIHGIRTTSCIGRSLRIDSNRITHADYGISLINNTAALQNVTANELYVNDPALMFIYPSTYTLKNTYGIYQTEVSNAVKAKCTIYNNNITNGLNSIFLNNVGGTKVQTNQVSQSSMQASRIRQTGISAASCLNISVYGNAILGNGALSADDVKTPNYNSPYRKMGIRFSNSRGVVCGNILGHDTDTSRGIGYGIEFEGNCMGAMVHSNTFNRNKYGLVLRSNGTTSILSDQGYDGLTAQSHQNVFEGDGTSSHNFANTDNYRTQSFINISLDSLYKRPIFYFIGSLNAANTLYSSPSGAIVNGQLSPSNAILPQLITATPDHLLLASCPAQGSITHFQWYKTLAEDSTAYIMEPDFESTGIWLEKRFAYNLLRYDTAALASDTLIQQLFDSLNIQDPGIMGSFEDTLQLLYDSATLNHATGTLYSDLVGRSFSSLRYLSNASQSENFRSINGIYLSTVAIGIDTFTSTQLDTINSLSSQCPYEAGDAVYIARSLRSLKDNNTYFDDLELCDYSVMAKKERVNRQKAEVRDSITAEFAKVFPNPTSGQIQLVFNAETEGRVQFEIVSLMGNVVLERTLEEGKHAAVLNGQGLSNGIYYWRLTDKNRVIKTGRISIIK